MKNTSKEWINAFEALTENYVQLTILLSATLTFHFTNKIKTFSDKEVLKIYLPHILPYYTFQQNKAIHQERGLYKTGAEGYRTSRDG